MKSNILYLIIGAILASLFFYCGNKPDKGKEDVINSEIEVLKDRLKDKDALIAKANDSIKTLVKRQDSVRIEEKIVIKEIEVEREAAKDYSEEQSETYLYNRFGSLNKTVEFVFDADILEIQYRSLAEVYEAEQQINIQNQFKLQKKDEQLAIKDTIIDKKEEVIEIKNNEIKAEKTKVKIWKGVAIVGGAAFIYSVVKK